MSTDIDYLMRQIRNFTRTNSSRRRRRKTRFLQHFAYTAQDIDSVSIDSMKREVFLGTSDVKDYITSNIMLQRNKQKLQTTHIEFTLLANRKEWINCLCSLKDINYSQVTTDTGVCVEPDFLQFFTFDISATSITVRVYGSLEFVEKWHYFFTDKFEEVKNIIEWVYSNDGQSVEIPLGNDKAPVDEMYPFLDGEPLTDYYDRFINSSSTILLLIGPPGTGKTTFIRGLLQHTQSSAMVTYDTAVLTKDYLFASFLDGERNILVLEDADNFLGARSDGNDMMHKFLNVGDGLVTLKNKKMIFSTNLPSIKNIDPALVRPGRCFDIINFRNFDQREAEKLALKLDIQLEGSRESWSLADIFHKQIEAFKSPQRKVGFY